MGKGENCKSVFSLFVFPIYKSGTKKPTYDYQKLMFQYLSPFHIYAACQNTMPQYWCKIQ